MKALALRSITAGLVVLTTTGCEQRGSETATYLAAVLVFGAAGFALGVLLGRRRRSKAIPLRPWSLTPDQARSGFDQIRAGIAVSDEELGRAIPVGRRWKRHERQKALPLNAKNQKQPKP